MSQLAATEFFNTASGNPGLIAQLSAAAEGRSSAEAGEAVAALGAEAGFEFSGADALAVRESTLAKVDSLSAAGEDAVLEGVRGGSGTGDPYLDAQIGTFISTIGLIGPTGTGTVAPILVGAATGDAGGAAIEAGNGFNDFKEAVQDFFSGW